VNLGRITERLTVVSYAILKLSDYGRFFLDDNALLQCYKE